MKPISKIVLGSLLLIGLPLAWTGCVGPGGDDDGGGYGGGDVWVHDDTWIDGGGRGWYGGHGDHAYVHPSGGNRGGGGEKSGGGDRGGGDRGGGGDKGGGGNRH